MRKGKASRTAEMVAVWRALGNDGYSSVPAFSDALAAKLVRGRWARWLEQMRARLGKASGQERARIVDRFDHVLLRVASLDRLLRDALAAGARQVVLLGAGLDTRAWRLPELAGARLFEVDHPDTQRLKQERVAGLPAPMVAPRFVPVDFAADSLTERLTAAGYDARVPTVWLWEGVVMYLPDSAVAATLSAVATLSAPGSRLLLHYHTPEAWSGWALVRRLFLWALGEPQIGLRTPDAVASLVRAAGLEVVRDLSVGDQAALVQGTAPMHPSRQVSRILVARKGG
jgi:methyltransferase (TIGR00027 family)